MTENQIHALTIICIFILAGITLFTGPENLAIMLAGGLVGSLSPLPIKENNDEKNY